MKRFAVAATASFTALFLALTLGVGAMAQAAPERTVEITGFDNNSASVGSDITAQITAKVVAPIKMALSHAPNDRVTITLVGGADQTGKSGVNYAICMDRAKAVQSVLLEQLPPEKFPNVTINLPRSNGTEAGARMVKVKLQEFVPSPATPPASPRNPWTLPVIMIALIAILAWIGARKIMNSRKPVPEQEPMPVPTEAQTTNLVTMPPPAPQQPWRGNVTKQIESKKGGFDVTFLEKYGEDREGKGGWYWYTPFPPPNNMRKKFGAAKNAAKDSLNTLPDSEIEQLIADTGLISKRYDHKKEEKVS